MHKTISQKLAGKKIDSHTYTPKFKETICCYGINRNINFMSKFINCFSLWGLFWDGIPCCYLFVRLMRKRSLSLYVHKAI